MSVDLSALRNTLQTVNSNVLVTQEKVEGVSTQVRDLTEQNARARGELNQLSKEFLSFRDRSLLNDRLQRITEELNGLRAEYESSFGHQKSIRRMARGILEAVDFQSVSLRVLREATEGVTITQSGFWLPLALQALAFWLADNKARADNALEGSLRHDASKTAMFFALVNQRCTRNDATSRWLRLYLQAQRAAEMDRHVVVMLNAMASGVFGIAPMETCLEYSHEWFEDLEAEADFEQQQVDRWKHQLEGLLPTVGDNEYPAIREFSPTWSRLETSLARVRRTGVLMSELRSIFEGEITVPRGLTAEVSDLLGWLVNDHDPEALDLARDIAKLERERVHLLQSSVDDPDSVAEATAGIDAFFEAKLDFGTMLSNIAMKPADAHATQGARRYATALSKKWLIEAHRDMVTADHMAYPTDIELTILRWNGVTKDGRDEQQLVDSLTKQYDAQAAAMAAQVKWPLPVFIVPLVALVLVYLFGLGNVFSWVVLAGAAGFVYWQYREVTSQRIGVQAPIVKERDDAVRVIRAACAEVVDLRQEWDREDARAADREPIEGQWSSEVERYLERITPEQYLQQLAGATRRVIA